MMNEEEKLVMRFDCLTLFPDMLRSVLEESIIGRAVANEILQINYINIRDYANNKHNRVDDAPYGGGQGMVMQPMPIYDAYQDIIKEVGHTPKVLYLSPQGKVFNQEMAKQLAKEKHLVLLCGHYEGVDERVIEEIVDEEVSIGDFVLTGGEIPAMAVIDAVARLLPGVLSSEESFSNESHYDSLLEYPQYTRPPEFRGRAVPEVLLSGHHKNIEEWRRKQSIRRTYLKRPDMLENAQLTEKESCYLEELKEEFRNGHDRKND